MTPPDDRSDEFPDRPRPELLAGCADGELSAPQRRRVAAWVASDPAAAAELERQRSLSRRRRRFWRAAAPPDPGAAAWAGVLARIERSLSPQAQAAAGPPPSPGWTTARLGRLAAAAAAVALVVGAPVPRWPAVDANVGAPAPLVVPDSTAPEPFALLAEQDVDILSVRPVDAAVLLVGGLPLPKDVQLASAADVTVYPPPAGSEGGRPDPAEAGDPMILPAPRGD